MSDQLFAVGATSPPATTQVRSTRSSTRNDGTTGASFEDELRAQQTRQEASERPEAVENNRPVEQKKPVETQQTQNEPQTEQPDGEETDGQAPDGGATVVIDPSLQLTEAFVDPALVIQQVSGPVDPAELVEACADVCVDAAAQDASHTAQTTPMTIGEKTAPDASLQAEQSTANGQSFAGVMMEQTGGTQAEGGIVIDASQASRQAAAQPVASQETRQAVGAAETTTPEAARNTTNETPAQVQQVNVTDAQAAVNAPTTQVNQELVRVAEARAHDMVAQVTRSMETMVKGGQNWVRLQLYPEDLGKVDLKLVSHPNGVNVTMIAEQPAAGKLLESQMNALRQTLTEAGIQVAHLDISFGNPQQSQGEAWQQPQPRYTNASKSMISEVGSVTGGEALEAALQGVDYRI